MKKNCLLWLLVAAMAMTSCQDEFIKNENKTSDKIGYAVETNSISEPLKSRASRSTDNTDVTIEELGQTLCGGQLGGTDAESQIAHVEGTVIDVQHHRGGVGRLDDHGGQQKAHQSGAQAYDHHGPDVLPHHLYHMGEIYHVIVIGKLLILVHFLLLCHIGFSLIAYDYVITKCARKARIIYY